MIRTKKCDITTEEEGVWRDKIYSRTVRGDNLQLSRKTRFRDADNRYIDNFSAFDYLLHVYIRIIAGTIQYVGVALRKCGVPYLHDWREPNTRKLTTAGAQAWRFFKLPGLPSTDDHQLTLSNLYQIPAHGCLPL